MHAPLRTLRNRFIVVFALAVHVLPPTYSACTCDILSPVTRHLFADNNIGVGGIDLLLTYFLTSLSLCNTMSPPKLMKQNNLKPHRRIEHSAQQSRQ